VLSVGIRSITSRNSQIDDLLLCLSAQTEQNFEIILITDCNNLNDMSEIISRYDIDFQNKIQLECVPLADDRVSKLKKIIKLSNKEFILFIDDDDHITYNYIENVTKSIKKQTKSNVPMLFVFRSAYRHYEYPKSKSECSEYKSNLVKLNKEFGEIYEMYENFWPFSSLVYETRALKAENLDNDIQVLEDWRLTKEYIYQGCRIIWGDDSGFIYNIRKSDSSNIDIDVREKGTNGIRKYLAKNEDNYDNFIKGTIDFIENLKFRINEVGMSGDSYRILNEELSKELESIKKSKAYSVAKKLSFIKRIMHI
jgi:hypothetical protein